MDATPSAHQLVCGTIGGLQDPTVDCEVELTIGENATSLGQLVKKYTRLFLTGSSDGTPTANQGSVNPFALGAFKSTTALAGLTHGDICGDYISLFSSLYAFWRGGVRIRMLTDPSSTNQIVTLCMAPPSSNNTSNNPRSIGATLVGDQFLLETCMYAGHASFVSNLGGGFSAQVPAYQKGRYRPVQMAFVTNSNPDNNSVFVNHMHVCWKGCGATSTAASFMYRAGADDFQLGLFLCIPPMSTSMNGQ